jgi:hypothetical protein
MGRIVRGSFGDVTTPRPLAVVDIDGVVADVRHRLRYLERDPKDWDAFFAAAPLDPSLPEGVDRVGKLLVDHEVVYLTGRPERCRRDTVNWLTAHGLGGHPVLMRRNGDHRPARRIKLRHLDRLATRAPVAIVVDDDPDVCAALRAAGYPVQHADWMTRSATLHVAQEVEGRT